MSSLASSMRHGATIHRQPVVHPDRSVFAYAVRGVVPGEGGLPVDEHLVEHVVDAVYRTLDLSRVAGSRPLIIRATHQMLASPLTELEAPHGVVLEVPGAHQTMPGASARLAALTESDARVALGDYTADPVQDALLPYVQMVKVDSRLPRTRLEDLVRRAADAGAVVLAEHATTRERVGNALEAGAELLQGPLVLPRDHSAQARTLGAGEVQCFELLRQLAKPDPDPAEYTRTIASDAELTMRVLHLVNSSAAGVRHKIDSVQQAVVLVGPRRLGAIATASLVGSTPTSLETLWFLLTRAHTCASLAGDDTGYTVGLLSAVAAHLRVPATQVVARTGVSPAVAEALANHAGPYGSVLAAVVAQEASDTAALASTGHDPYEVGRHYLDAVPHALSLATRLAAAA